MKIIKKGRTDIFNRFVTRARRQPKGQSLTELLLVMVILALLMAGVVEFGFMLNNYLHVLDAAREGARYSSTAIAYDLKTGATIPEFYYYTTVQTANTMAPVKLDPTKGDDIVISVISAYASSLVRHPSASGWDLCGNYTAFVNYLWANDPHHPADPLQSVPEALADPNWYTCPAQASRLSDAELQARLVTGAQDTGISLVTAGVLLVEVIYNYPQILKLPVFSNGSFLGVQFSLIPDPIPVYVYAIMPISSAEPTQAP